MSRMLHKPVAPIIQKWSHLLQVSELTEKRRTKWIREKRNVGRLASAPRQSRQRSHDLRHISISQQCSGHWCRRTRSLSTDVALQDTHTHTYCPWSGIAANPPHQDGMMFKKICVWQAGKTLHVIKLQTFQNRNTFKWTWLNAKDKKQIVKILL